MSEKINIKVGADGSELEREIDALFARTRAAGEQVKQDARIQVLSSIQMLSAFNDALRSMGRAAGRSVDIHFLTLLSQVTSQILQLKLLAATAAATPGMQMQAMIYLAFVSQWITMGSMFAQERVRLRTMLQANNTDLLRGIVDYLI